MSKVVEKFLVNKTTKQDENYDFYEITAMLGGLKGFVQFDGSMNKKTGYILFTGLSYNHEFMGLDEIVQINLVSKAAAESVQHLQSYSE